MAIRHGRGWGCTLIATLAISFSATALHAADEEKMPAAGKSSGDTVPTLPGPTIRGQRTPAPSSEPGPPTNGPYNYNDFNNSQNFNGQDGGVLDGTMFNSPSVNGYSAQSATTGTGFDSPLIDFPGTVDVVPRDTMRDQQAIEFTDILRDVGSAVKLGDSLRPDAFLLRGFEIRSRDFRKDGFLDPSSAPRDLANTERIEVLKGPASILYGSGQPSGVVNFISKRPLSYGYNYGEMQFGSFGLQRYTFDTTGPVTDCGDVLVRFNGAYQNSDSFRDFGFDERTFLAPAVTFVLDDCTRITWEGEYQYDRRRFDTGVIAINGQLGQLPRSRFLNEPDDFQRFTDYKSSLFLEHDINDCWSVKIGERSTWYSAPQQQTVPIAEFPAGPDTIVSRQRRVIDPFSEEYHSVIADLSGKTEIAGFENKLLLGTEEGWFVSNNFSAQQSIPGTPPLLLDANNPVYGTGGPVPTPLFVDFDYDQSRYSVYGQDLVKLNENWLLMGGVRYDRVHEKFDRLIFAPPNIRTDSDYDRTTPKAGIVFQPVPDQLSFYFSYSESFDPPGGGLRFDPRPFLPETGKIYEGGVKMQLADNLSATVSGYHILKDNILFDDVTTFTTTQIGEARDDGFEIEMVGNLTQYWSVIFNAAYNDSRVLEDAVPTRIGQPLRNVPLQNGSIWTRYDLIQMPCETLGVALGMIYVGDRSGDLDNTFTLPSYTRWDAGVYYSRGCFRSSVYVENIFDKVYYSGSESPLAVFPGAPTNFRASLGWVF